VAGPDLLMRWVNRSMAWRACMVPGYTLSVLHRAAAITLFLVWHSVRWLAGWLALVVTLKGRAARLEWFASSLLALFRDLGATFIKVGQIMSTRPDLLPPHIIHALETLQDRVGPFAFEHVRRAIEEDFGAPVETIFEELSEEPIASASVAQVHRARLPDGTLVAVKVRRPRLEEIVPFDLAVVRAVARVMELIPSVKLLAPVSQVEEFGQAIRMQLDFRIEAGNNRRFRTLFAGDPDVIFPELVESLCSERVLVMGFVEGVKILQVARTAPGHDPSRLARVGFRVLLKMIFEDGFVHADLHPGNILVTHEGKVALLDLGLVGTLDDFHRKNFARFFALWAQGDGRGMAQIMIDLSPSPDTVPDPAAFREAVHAFVLPYIGKQLGEVQVGTVALGMMAILRRHRVRVNATFTLCNIAIAVTEGIGKQLDPQLDLMQEALPFFMRMRL
jgi:ubiquinone biosynthesis protein